ncbi:DNA polymerase III subunit gamma and tau [Actinomadura craniellae]|uniref:DNA polymerase III subunit gamma/tau n=1 Tax=Actinomadura craniellae TaxID=2231787 RepID=A0A365H6S5_9ACTN|nr:DNA polymerase III subunit gamma and tau [Actinomadura craniellae]RAY14787.1 DNA polymerase III subunit gamma and tau [Actinomadura craniellae]
MSLALYRKYRPATFAELKGQEHVAEPLQQALRNGRINHAYLFSGPRGCGKTSSARILARSLNCELGPTPEPCGKCDSCVALGPSGSGHIDVIEIDAASHGGVDDARDLRERAFFAPVSARFKVYIIDEAHMVSREGFNALLKLVEEPPPHLKFVFATTEPEKVIGTIRSRTHHYPFRLVPPGVLRELVEEILGAENVPYEPAALPLVVRAGAGSARDTLSILDQLLAGADDAGITYARAVSLLGYTDAALLDEVVDAFAARDGAAVFASIDRVVEGGQDPRRFAGDLLTRLRDLVILANVPEAASSGLLDAPPDEMEALRRQATAMGPGDLARAADLLHGGLTEMRGATSPRLLLELICARILLPGAYEDEASLYARLDRLERRAAAGPAVPQGGPSLPPERPRPAVAEERRPVAEARPRPVRDPEPEPARNEEPVRPRPQAPQPPPAQGGDPTSSVQRTPAWPEVERRPVDNPPPQAQPPRPQPAATEGLDAETLRRNWPDILEDVKSRQRVAWMVLMEGVQVTSLEGNLLTLAFDNEGKRKGFTSGGRDAVVREVIKSRWGVELRIDTVPAGSAPPAGRTPPRPAPQPPPARPPQPAARPSAAPPQRPERPAEQPAPPRPPDDLPPPPDAPTPIDESDEVDPPGYADANGSEAEISGMALIQRELGGQIIREIDNS